MVGEDSRDVRDVWMSPYPNATGISSPAVPKRILPVSKDNLPKVQQEGTSIERCQNINLSGQSSHHPYLKGQKERKIIFNSKLIYPRT